MGGFDFSNYARNAALQAQGAPPPQAVSTGTTIVGCKFDGGVVIAAGEIRKFTTSSGGGGVVEANGMWGG